MRVSDQTFVEAYKGELEARCARSYLIPLQLNLGVTPDESSSQFSSPACFSEAYRESAGLYSTFTQSR